MKLSMQVDVELPDDVGVETIVDVLRRMTFHFQSIDGRVFIKEFRMNGFLVELPARLMR